MEDVATESLVSVSSDWAWMSQLRQQGARSLLSTTKPRKHVERIDADSEELRALALKQANWRLARRLNAIADIADGQSIAAVATRRRTTEESVREWVRLFRMRGLSALMRRHFPTNSWKLDAPQREALEQVIRHSPDLGPAEVVTIIAERYCVRYTTEGAKRLVSRTLGFRYEGGRFADAAAAP